MTKSIDLSAALAVDLSRMIRRAFGNWGVAKQASCWADCSPHTIRDALAGRKELGAWKLLRLAHHSGFRAELRAYLDRIEQEDADLMMQLGRKTQKEIDAFILARLTRTRNAVAVARPSLAPMGPGAAQHLAGSK